MTSWKFNYHYLSVYHIHHIISYQSINLYIISINHIIIKDPPRAIECCFDLKKLDFYLFNEKYETSLPDRNKTQNQSNVLFEFWASDISPIRRQILLFTFVIKKSLRTSTKSPRRGINIYWYTAHVTYNIPFSLAVRKNVAGTKLQTEDSPSWNNKRLQALPSIVYLTEVFPKPPLFVYRRQKNIRE